MDMIYSSGWIGVSLIVILTGLIIWSLRITLNPELDEERVKTISGYFKYVIGSVVLVLITLFINKGLEERELAIQESQQLNEQVQYLIGQDVGVKKEYVQYFSIVTRSYYARKRWIEYFDKVKEEYDFELEKKMKKDSLIAKNDTLNTEYSNRITELNSKIDSMVKRIQSNAVSQNDFEAEFRKSKDDLVKVKTSFDSLQLANFYLKQEKKLIDQKLESSADKRISLVDIDLKSARLCNELLQPLSSYLTQSKEIYDSKYKKNGHRHEDAKLIYDLNKKMLNLLTDKSDLIPNFLTKDARKLVDHFNSWITGYENVLIKIPNPSNSTEFQVTYYGETFPTSSAKLFEQELNENCK